MEKRKATQQEKETLMEQWAADPCFDLYLGEEDERYYIEDFDKDIVVDYSAYKNEFKVYVAKKEKQWEEAREQRDQERADKLGLTLSQYRKYYQMNQQKADYCEQNSNKILQYYMEMTMRGAGHTFDSENSIEISLILEEIKRAAVYQAKAEIYQELLSKGLIKDVPRTEFF